MMTVRTNILSFLLTLTGAWLAYFPTHPKEQTYFGLFIFTLGGILLINNRFKRKIYPLTSTPNGFVSGNEFDQLFDESMSTLSILLGPDHIYTKANKKFFEFSGFPRSILGKPLREVYKGASHKKILEELDRVYKNGEKIDARETLVTLSNPDGTLRSRYLDFNYQPLRNPQGEIYGIVSQTFDVTERVLARKIIENERNNLINLFQQTPEMVCYLKGPEHLFEFVNEAHIKTLGFDATGKTVREAQPESVEVHGILDEVYRTGKTAELKEIPVTVTGQLRYFNLTYAAHTDEEGQINGVMILGTEVTDSIKQRRSLEREARLIDSIPSPFFAMDSNWKVVYWNPAAEEAIGRKKTEVVGKKLWDVFPDTEDSEFGRTYRQAREERKILSFEAHYPRHNRWYRVWCFPFEDGIAVSFLDVTDRKVIQEELERSKERYQFLFDYSPLPKIIFDIETLKIIDVNKTALKHYGYSREEFLTRTKADLRPPEDVALLKQSLIHKHTHTEVEVHTGLRHVKKDGTIINVEISALDINLNGRPARLCAIVDVTEKVKVENELQHLVMNLREAKAEAEKANTLKSAFLANMSHEIRTPLGAMIGFADLLRDPGLSREEHASYINIVTRNGEQLAAIINDILDLSKVEAGHLTLEYAETPPDHVAADVVSLLRVKANEKNIVLEYHSEPSSPESIVTDSLRLRQILMNIVGNAIKFTHAGSVKVKSYGQTGTDGKMYLYFEVTDTGIGIPESQKEKVFDAFVQADGALSRKYGGTGLGLALSRQLARELGGDLILAKSIEGKGTSFLICVADRPELNKTVESSRSREEIKYEVPENALDGIRVLIVDDSPDNRQLLWHFLNKYGATIDFAENGLLGYRKALSGNFNVVLMDIQMPEMDGYTATQKLRESGYTKPIIALTAHAMDEVRKKCLNVGCTDHLTKPIRPKELINAVVKYSR